jgi:hypothetical protein
VQATISLLDNLQRRLFTLHIPLTQLQQNGQIYEGVIRLQDSLITPQHYNFLFDLFIAHQSIFDYVSGHFPIKITDNGSRYAGFEGTDYGFYFINYEIVK